MPIDDDPVVRRSNRPGINPESRYGSRPYSAAPGQDQGSFRGLRAPNRPQVAGGRGSRDPWDVLSRQRSLLGGLGDLLPENFVLDQGGVGMLQAGLNFDQYLASERDREAGIGQYQSSLAGLGLDPESTLAREMAVRRAQGDRPFGAEQVAAGRSALKDRGAMAAQDASRQLSEQIAARGLGGGLPAMQQAQLQQQQSLGLSGQLADYDVRAGMLAEELERQSFQDLSGLADRRRTERLGLEDRIARAYLDTQRQPLDFSNLLGTPPHARLPVGGWA